jgi:hypothetical protein
MSIAAKAIAQAFQDSQEASTLRGRVLGIQIGTVTNNGVTDGLPLDPLNMRRIKVRIPEMGTSETDWLFRINFTGYADLPVPKNGATVAVAFVNGDPHKGCWFGEITNARNPSYEQNNARDDSFQTIPGDRMQAVQGNETNITQGDRENTIEGGYDFTCEGQENRRTEKNLDVSGGASMTIANDAGCTIRHDETGFTCHTDKTGAGLGVASGMIAIADRFGNVIGLGGATGLDPSGKPTGTPGNMAGGKFVTDVTIDLNGQALHFVNAGDVTINGKSIAVVGARDSRGDVLVDRGY